MYALSARYGLILSERKSVTSSDPSLDSADDTQTRLRVGGWLPPYDAFRSDTGPHTPPLVYRSHPPKNIDASYALSRATKSERRRSAVVFCAAIACLLMIGVTLTQLGERPGTPETATEAEQPISPLLPPFLPASMGPPLVIDGTAPSGAAALPPTTDVRQQRPPVEAAATTATRRPTSAPTATTSGAKPEPTNATTSPPAPGLRIDAPLNLALSAAPGLLVRHRDFRGRVDRIGTSSSALDRADARFIVRRGLADDDCVSFESSNYPGRFLRHRNFEIRLDRRDGSGLFDQDATFCAETRGGAIVLRSHNYPDRFVTESGSLLRLTPASTATATRFVVRPPL